MGQAIEENHLNVKGVYKIVKSRYEKYVVRSSTPPDPSIKWGIPELGIPGLYHFLTHLGPLKESNTMLEYAWIVKDSAFGVTEDKPPHSHGCDEIFLFMGTNPEEPEKLGAEIEFWLGDEPNTITKSCVIFVPKGVSHCPLILKRVDRPIFHFATATDKNYRGPHEMENE